MPSESDVGGLEYSVKGNAVIWHVTDFDALFTDYMDIGLELYTEISGQSDRTATIVQFDGAPMLGAEKQEHINTVWSELAQAVEIDRAGYVGDGIAAMAVESNVEAPGVAVESFTDLEEAVEWAQQGG